MNYAVMYGYAVDRDSGQFKAPFNQINNEARVFTYQDTAMTMYDGKTQLLIENPKDRYLINSSMLPGLRQNDDGSVTLYIQKDRPGWAKETNWLPAPNGPIYPVMRPYWPKTEAPSILPPGDGTWSLPGIAKMQ